MDAAPVAVSANGAHHVTGGQDNMAYITLYFESGAIAHVSVNWLAPVKIRQTLIGGSRRMIVYDDLQPSEKVKVYDRGVNLSVNEDDRHKMLVSYRMGDMWGPEISVKEALLSEIEHFTACIRHEAKPMTGGESGLRVVKALEAATISLRKQGHPIELTNLKEAS
jgi:predicted dehydrogenase